jgi:hypothetical protein
MHVTHSREHTNPMRIFRAAILNSVPVPEAARAQLQAQGVDTGELEARLLQQIGKH